MRFGVKVRMVKISTIALVVTMLVIGLCAGLVSSPFILPQNSSKTDTVWESIQRNKVIKIGTDATWPPYQLPPYQLPDDASNIVGFEVDLANACAEKLGLTIEWNNVAFDDIIPAVQGGQLHMGVSGFSVIPERIEQVSFTLPHSTTEGQVVMLQSTITEKSITTVNSLADFKSLGITVGVQSGNVQEEELRAAGVDIVTWRDSATPFHDIVSSQPSIQAVYAETPITTTWIAQLQEDGKAASVVYSHPYYPVAFLTAKSSTMLLDQMNGALAELIYDGTVSELKAKWNA